MYTLLFPLVILELFSLYFYFYNIWVIFPRSSSDVCWSRWENFELNTLFNLAVVPLIFSQVYLHYFLALCCSLISRCISIKFNTYCPDQVLTHQVLQPGHQSTRSFPEVTMHKCTHWRISLLLYLIISKSDAGERPPKLWNNNSKLEDGYVEY